MFSWPVRVYIEDTDLGGIVYHSNYLKFMERARTEWLRQFGYSQEKLRQQDTLFVVRSLQIDYKAPARLDDELIVTVVIEQTRKVGLLIKQQVIKALDHTLLIDAQVEIACISCAGRVKAMPSAFIESLSAN